VSRSKTSGGKGRTIRETLRIESLAAGGAGVARLASGAAVFVPRTAPGELIEAEVSLAGKPAQGRVLRVVEPSPDRVVPPCPYVESCGGCDWMHLTANVQAEAHAAIVRSALRMGGLRWGSPAAVPAGPLPQLPPPQTPLIAHSVPGAPLPEIRVHAAPSPLAYRTRARLFLEARRGKVRVGYRAAGSHAIAAVDACLVLDPAVAPLLGELARVLAGASGEGDAQIARGREGRPVVSLSWRGELPASAWAAIDGRVAQAAWAGARVTLHGAASPAIFGDPRPILAGADGAPLVIAPGGFAQPSDEGAARLARRAAELAALDPGGRTLASRHVVELFAGSGTLSVLLAARAASFTAVEIDPEACAAARQNLADRGLAARVIAADADAWAIPPATNVVVLDPPRAGAPGAARAIAASGARVVVYVSCDPPTLGRDLGILTGGRLGITHLETFELFPQTSHVETVVRLERAR
jgi:23S rRNA (uracil1939-C5)-methyltransferase